MKRAFLLLLSFLFLLLWVTGLVYAKQTSAIYMALIVSLLFYMRSLMTIQPPGDKRSLKEQLLNRFWK